MKKVWNFIKYVFGGQMAQDQLEDYLKQRRPQTEQDRLNAIRDYIRMRGGM